MYTSPSLAVCPRLERTPGALVFSRTHIRKHAWTHTLTHIRANTGRPDFFQTYFLFLRFVVVWSLLVQKNTFYIGEHILYRRTHSI